MADTSLSVYPIRCHTCMRVLGNKYETFRAIRQECIEALLRADEAFDRAGKEASIPSTWRQKRARYEGPATRMAFAKIGLTGPFAKSGIQKPCEGCRSQLMTSLDKHDIMNGVGSVVNIMRNTHVLSDDEEEGDDAKIVEIVLPRNVVTRIGDRMLRSRRAMTIRSVPKSESLFGSAIAASSSLKKTKGIVSEEDEDVDMFAETE